MWGSQFDRFVSKIDKIPENEYIMAFYQLLRDTYAVQRIRSTDNCHEKDVKSHNMIGMEYIFRKFSRILDLILKDGDTNHMKDLKDDKIERFQHRLPMLMDNVVWKYVMNM